MQQYPSHDPYRAQARKATIWLVVGVVALFGMGSYAVGAGMLEGLQSRPLDKDALMAARNDLNSAEITSAYGQQAPPVTMFTPSTPDMLSQLSDEPPPLMAQLNEQPTPFMDQRIKDEPSILQQFAPPTSAVTEYRDTGPSMPADVKAWLLHLERIEEYRMSMTKEQLSQAIGQMMGSGMAGNLQDAVDEALFGESPNGGQNYDPSQRAKVQHSTAELRQAWRELNVYFNSKQPPAECVPLKNTYETTLGETSTMMMDIMDAMEYSQRDPNGAISKLMQMMGTSEPRIDESARASERLLAGICRRYETRKWFKITPDVGGGLMGGMGGLGDISQLLDGLGGG